MNVHGEKEGETLIEIKVSENCPEGFCASRLLLQGLMFIPLSLLIILFTTAIHTDTQFFVVGFFF